MITVSFGLRRFFHVCLFTEYQGRKQKRIILTTKWRKNAFCHCRRKIQFIQIMEQFFDVISQHTTKTNKV